MLVLNTFAKARISFRMRRSPIARPITRQLHRNRYHQARVASRYPLVDTLKPSAGTTAFGCLSCCISSRIGRLTVTALLISLQDDNGEHRVLLLRCTRPLLDTKMLFQRLYALCMRSVLSESPAIQAQVSHRLIMGFGIAQNGALLPLSFIPSPWIESPIFRSSIS